MCVYIYICDRILHFDVIFRSNKLMAFSVMIQLSCVAPLETMHTLLLFLWDPNRQYIGKSIRFSSHILLSKLQIFKDIEYAWGAAIIYEVKACIQGWRENLLSYQNSPPPTQPGTFFWSILISFKEDDSDYMMLKI